MIRIPSRGVAALLALALCAPVSLAQDSHQFSRRNPVVEAVAKTKTSIVTIRIPRNGAKDIVGTGIIVDERGYIVTNRHVVGASKTVTVNLYDGSAVQGEVLQADAHYDLAIVRIHSTKQLIAQELAPVNDLMVGETVIAIGHPFGYSNSVSTGIISAVGREITMPTGDVLQGLIQTDASINPGNSGGPLFNINGELIGINVALREGAQGIAFAINAGTVKGFLNQYLSAKNVAGVSHGLQFNEKIVAETGDRSQVIVQKATTGGMTGGDQIVAVGDRGVQNTFDVERALWDKKPGEKVDCKVVRQGKEMSVTLTMFGNSAPATTVATREPSTTRQTPTTATMVSVSMPKR